MRDQRVELLHLVGGETDRQTELAHAAGLAMRLQIAEHDDRRQRRNAGGAHNRRAGGYRRYGDWLRDGSDGGRPIRKNMLLTRNRAVEPRLICGESTGCLLIATPSTAWTTGTTAPAPTRGPIGIRIPESFARLPTASAVRRRERVPPHRRRGAPCAATLQAECSGNRQSRRPPATTTRKRRASWHLVTVKRPSGAVPVGRANGFPSSRRVQEVGYTLAVDCPSVCPLTDLAGPLPEP